MMALGFGAILAGAVLGIAGVTGSSIASVVKGKPDKAKDVTPSPEAASAVGKASAAPGFNASPVASQGGSSQIRKWAAEGLQAAGVPATAQNVNTIVGRIMQESSGNPNSINNWDSNAKAGHPSQGLLQTIPETFRAYHVKGTSTNILDPVANVAVAVRYMLSRYGHLVGPGPGGY